MAKWKEPIINVIDLEATCWESKMPPTGQMNEIIEIGICQFNFKTGVIDKPFGFLCKPVNSTVSEFCTKLTTITPELLQNEGAAIDTQMEKIVRAYAPADRIFASYGEYDKNMLHRECTFKYMLNPFARSIHFNVKTLFAMKFKLDREVGMDKALSIAKIPLVGTHHRGVDDALNIAKLLKAVLA